MYGQLGQCDGADGHQPVLVRVYMRIIRPAVLCSYSELTMFPVFTQNTDSAC